MPTRMWAGGVLLALAGFLAACDGNQTTEAPLKLPEKEKTWVKTEKVETTKDDALAVKEKTTSVIAENADLKARLTEVHIEVQGKIKDQDSCLKLLEPMDKKRMALQREGGMWHAFERSDDLRPHSHYGMQLDSKLNILFSSLRHLCKTAEGVPMDDLGRKVNGLIDRLGKEGARQKLLDLGEPPKDIDSWITHAEFARKNLNRKIPYADIETLILKTRPLLDLYENLYNRQVDAQSVPAFLSDTVTLLAVIKEYLKQDPTLVMARHEDEEKPYENFRVDL